MDEKHSDDYAVVEPGNSLAGSGNLSQKDQIRLRSIRERGPRKLELGLSYKKPEDLEEAERKWMSSKIPRVNDFLWLAAEQKRKRARRAGKG